MGQQPSTPPVTVTKPSELLKSLPSLGGEQTVKMPSFQYMHKGLTAIEGGTSSKTTESCISETEEKQSNKDKETLKAKTSIFDIETEKNDESETGVRTSHLDLSDESSDDDIDDILGRKVSRKKAKNTNVEAENAKKTPIVSDESSDNDDHPDRMSDQVHASDEDEEQPQKIENQIKSDDDPLEDQTVVKSSIQIPS